MGMKVFSTRGTVLRGLPGGSIVNNPPANPGDTDLIPGVGRYPGEGNGKPLQYSWSGNSMDGEAWRAAVHACMLSHFSRVQLFVTLWTVAHPTPLSIGFCRQDCWSVLPCPLPGHLPNRGIKPTSPETPELQADSSLLSHWGSLGCSPRGLKRVGLDVETKQNRVL